MADPHSPRRCRRSLAALLSLLIACGPLLTPAYAAGLIPLANEPIGTQNNAPPAIVLTVDDSSSMLSDWLPEAVARDDFDINYFCRDGVGAMTSVCGSTGASNSFGTAPDQFYSPGFTAQQFGYPFPLTTGNVGPAAAQPYDPSGPGAGCFQGPAFVPPTCYHGVDPTLSGSVPNGIGNFPIPDPNDPTSPPVGWPLAGNNPYTSPVNPEPGFNLPYANAFPYGVYPYWQLWPAPVHNAATNALYYNPQLTYEPPVDSTGASYPQMNAANTGTWTQVPADPWATTVVNINLTSPVTVGVWCNSDWSMGAVTVVNGVLTIDPTQCRRNGTAAAAAGSGGATDAQDYTYPWAPPGFVPSASPGDTFTPNGTSPYLRAPSTLFSYAAQKVTLNVTGLDALSINTTNWNATSQDAKYFYENENILWCDPSSPSWPGQNSTTHVPCTNIVNPTTCNGVQTQVCNLQTQTCNAQTQVCNGAQTQVCNTQTQTCNAQTQVCNGAQSQVCNLQTQTCSGGQTQTCAGAQTQTCIGEQTQTCNGAQTQTCVGEQTQTCSTTAGLCNGAITQTCNGAVTQTCSAQTQTCNLQTQTCNAQTQTCNAQTQTCNLQTQTCAGVQTQTCGLQTQTCVGNTQVCNMSSQTCNGVQTQVCNLPGTQTCQPPVCTTTYSPPGCNLLPPDPENPCTGTSNCAPPVCTPNPGTCSLQPTVSCTSNANCPTLPGTCNVGGQSCLTSSACPQVGTCSLTGTSCTSNAQCLLAGGHCSIQTGTTCQQNTDCVQAGYCSVQTGTVCTSNANCPNISGHCSIQTGSSCLVNTDCAQAGYCSIQTGTVCTSSGNCPIVAGHCNIQTGTSCTTAANCPTIAGVCNIQTGTSCTSAANCPQAGYCSVQTGTLCTSNANCPTPVPGTCSSSGATCTSAANCPTIAGHCSVQTGTSCTSAANCPTVAGVCSVQTGTSCTSAANCPTISGHCSTQTGTACTTAANCPTIAGLCNNGTTSCTTNANCPTFGHCTVQTGTACTTNSQCATVPGHCSVQTGTACTANSGCATVPGTCSVQTTTSCTSAANCPTIAGHCSVQTGTSCTANSGCATVAGHCTVQTGTSCTANSGCPSPVPGVCSIQTTTSCTSAANCPQAGYCSVQTGTICTSNAGCATVPGTCSIQTGTSCTSNANCPVVAGNCNIQTGTSCTSAANCPPAGYCSVQTGTQCTSNGNCPTVAGTCSIQTGTSCTTNGNCPTIAGNCNIQTGTSCTTAGNCPAAGYCSVQSSTVCTSNANCPTVAGTCQVGGASCLSNSTCPLTGTCSGYPTLTCTSSLSCPFVSLPASGVTCSTTGVGGVPTADLRQDAENNGVVCRRNNKAYAQLSLPLGGVVPAVAASGYNYPNDYFPGGAGGHYTTPVTGGTGADACTVTPHLVSVPRHYWNTSVEWCTAAIVLAGDKWLGYGTGLDSDGSCQPGYDATHIYPRFYQYGPTSYVDNYANAAFQRVDLDITQQATASYTTTWIDASGTQQSITRNFADEMTNYANWYAYYRTRVQAVKTVTSLVFNQLDNTFNVGFATLSNGVATTPQAPLLPQSDPATFVNVAPFNAAQKAAWFQQLFGITIPLGLETPTLDAMTRVGDYFLHGSSAVFPGATNPITLSCQKNWHILFTDGFVNQASAPTIAGDQDLTVPLYPDYNGNPGTNPIAGLVPGQAWPHPYQEDPNNPDANGQADYAMYYWVQDMRPLSPLDPTSPNNVPTSSTDPADWQHLNFAALALGTHGKLNATNPSLTLNQLSAGTLQWPAVIPNVWHPDASGVDDLWHAAVNGRGQFVNAASAAQLQLGMGQILENITNQAGSRSAAGFSTNTITATNNSIYQVSFQPGWGGDVVKIPVDPVTGLGGAPVWDAAAQLGTQLLIAAPGDTPWFTNRKVFTVNDANQAVPFLWANLSATEQNSLAPGLPATGQQILAYLRGDPTNEGISVGQFRVRASVASGEDFLGDIVDSSALYVPPPNAGYLDGNDPGYSAFVASKSARPTMVYYGANDGMLHAITDATGNEAWAFMPHDLYRADDTGLGALSYQDGALPPFRHHYYVDSTPRVVDVDFGSQNWHSLLVGGLGKGGTSYYALDVTNPASVTSEVAAANQYLWTFTDPDMGYSYMQPIIAKTRAFGGAWLVIVPAGYNNPSGVGKIFFINAATGVLVNTMSTGFGDPADPSGLAQIAAYTTDYRNQLAEQIYGGDMYGNFWRFDVSDPNPANWSVVQMAYLTDPSGAPQAVTTTPNIEVDAVNGIDRWVFVGTGRLLDPTDLSNPAIANQIQTMYAIRDGTGVTPAPISAAIQPRASMVALIDKLNGLTSEPLVGWYDDLPLGQRIITPPQASISIVAYAGTSPQTDPCLTGEPATLYVRSFAFGASLLSDANGNAVAGLYETSGAVGMDIFSFPTSTSSASTGALDIRVGVTAGTTGDVTFFKVNVNFPFDAQRMSWRLLGQ